LEQQHLQGYIDLFFADETRISEEGYVPYGWQFEDEDVCIKAARGRSLNCFGLLSRGLVYHGESTESMINADFVLRFMDSFSLKISRVTLVVFDNAAVHRARKIRERFEVWQQRGLFIFFLPPYSPQLNIIERFWKELKEGWLKPEDYHTADDLFYAVNQILAGVGTEFKMDFAEQFHF